VSRILLALTLAAPITVLAQYATTGPNGQVAPAGSTVVVVGNGGGPILSTPASAPQRPPTRQFPAHQKVIPFTAIPIRQAWECSRPQRRAWLRPRRLPTRDE